MLFCEAGVEPDVELGMSSASSVDVGGECVDVQLQTMFRHHVRVALLMLRGFLRACAVGGRSLGVEWSAR